MCGIVGLYTKNPDLEQNLGKMLSEMLVQMTDRGPDSAGVAIYHDPVSDDSVKITLQGNENTDWSVIEKTVQSGLDKNAKLEVIATHAVLSLKGNGDESANWIESHINDIKITSVGSSIEIFKEKGAAGPGH